MLNSRPFHKMFKMSCLPSLPLYNGWGLQPTGLTLGRWQIRSIPI